MTRTRMSIGLPLFGFPIGFDRDFDSYGKMPYC